MVPKAHDVLPLFTANRRARTRVRQSRHPGGPICDKNTGDPDVVCPLAHTAL